MARSLRTNNLADARAEPEILSLSLGAPVRQTKVDNSFHRFAQGVIAHDQHRLQRGECKQALIDNLTRILTVSCDESLGSLDVRKISHATSQDFVDELTSRDCHRLRSKS